MAQDKGGVQTGGKDKGAVQSAPAASSSRSHLVTIRPGRMTIF